MRNLHAITHLFAPGFHTKRTLDRYATYVYRCGITQLMNLGPRMPAVAGWPCYSWPPPLLLVGYQYLVAVCNDYNFDERAYTRIGFIEQRNAHRQFIDWSCLANCTYSINAGAYLRFLDVDDFENTLTRIQQSLLADRIAADLHLADPMRGLGRWRLPGQGNAARIMEQELFGGGGGGDLAPGEPLPSLAALVVEHYRHLQDCGPEVWGLCYRTASAVDRQEEEEEAQRQQRQQPQQQPQYASDAQVLAAIRQLRSAYFRFRLSLWRHNNYNNDDDDDVQQPTTPSSQNDRYRGAGLPSWLLPETPVDVQDEDPTAVSLGAWLLRFVRRFQRSPAESYDGDDPMNFFTEPLDGDGGGDPQEDELIRKERTRQMLAVVIDSLTLPRPSPPQQEQQQSPQTLVGGARPRPWRRGLRPRDPATGRAITQAMRRLRGENVRTFIASLPLPVRRRRRPRQQPPPTAAAAAEEEYVEIDDDEDEDELLDDDDPLEGPAPRLVIDEDAEEEVDEDEMVELWIDEVRRTVAAAIARLEEALRQGPAARVERVFFEFPTEFYRAMQQLMDRDDVTEITLRRWTIYFFICEHIASTLNYLYVRLRRQPFARRHLQLLVTQLVMRARDNEGEIVFSRIWNEHGEDGFQNIMRRVVRDLTATVTRAGAENFEDDQGGLEDFMNDIEWHENSGDVEEIIRQVTLNDADIDNIELSFRVKISGPVAFSGNQNIQTINRRVGVEVAIRDRNRLPLPQLHQMVNLPPAPPTVAPRPRGRNRQQQPAARGAPPMGQRALSRRFRGGPRNL